MDSFHVLSQRRFFFATILSLASMAFGGGPVVEQLPYGRFQDAWRVSNGEVEVVVAPSVGRIMRYGFVGGANALWENSDADVPGPVGWKNFGGSKTWLWPQNDWKSLVGFDWPPPNDLPKLTLYSITPTKDGLIMTSPVIPGYDLRVIRQIRMEATGTGVEVAERLEPVGKGPRMPVAPWVIIQVPTTASIRVKADRDYPNDRALTSSPTLATRPAADGWRELVQGNDSAKSFYPARVVTARFEQFDFVQELVPVPADKADLPYQTQIFIEGKKFPVESKRSRYVEVEFTVQPEKAAELPSLSVRWKLQRIP